MPHPPDETVDHLDDLDYALPEALIAQRPLPERDASRLLAVPAAGPLRHASIRDLPALLPPSLLVLNDTRVFPARIRGTKRGTGGRVELLLLRRLRGGAPERWRALGRASKGLRVGARLDLGPRGELEADVVEVHGGGELTVDVATQGGGDVLAVLERVGEVPLPPYVQRPPDGADTHRYQTVYADRVGAVAAPTAGLHFSDRLLATLEAAGHRLARVTLHVGAGTFLPVRADRLSDHAMHAEWYEVGEQTAAAIDAARDEGRPVVAVGTTVVRTLESVAAGGGRVHAGSGETSLFIRPPFEFGVCDALVTNFHLPRSTLLALVMAFSGVARIREAYAAAVAERYRFFSYGDACLLAPGLTLRGGVGSPR